jgi:hypothetical protein
MKYSDSNNGSKLIFYAIVVILIYLAFFGFNIPAAYRYTVSSVVSIFKQL